MSAPVELSHRDKSIIIAGLMTGLLLAALDQTIVSTALPTIVGDFGGIEHLSWVVTAYLLGSTTSMPLYGKISDLYGRKRVYQTAIVIFVVASALCGLAQSMGQLIAFRALQGLGAGGLMSLTFTIIGDIVSPRERGRYTGYLTGVFALASVLGPLIGGFFTDHLSWRWVFYVNLPIGIVALIVTGLVLRLPVHKVEHRLDLVGSGALVVSVLSLLLATVWASEDYGWGSPVTVGLYTVAAVAAIWFVWWERRASEPVLPLRMFSRPGFTSCIVVSGLAGAAMFGAIVYLPLFFQGVQGKQATNAGLLLLPLMLAMMLTSLVVGRLTTRTGHYKAFPVAGTAVAAGGMWLMSTFEPDTSRWASSAWMAIVGAGVGATLPVLTVAVQNTVEFRDLGAGTASVNFFRTLGSTIGVAVFGSILTHRLISTLDLELARVDLPADVTTESLTRDPRALAALDEPLRTIAVTGLSDAITTVFLVGAATMVVGVVAAATIRELPLRDHIDVRDTTSIAELA